MSERVILVETTERSYTVLSEEACIPWSDTEEVVSITWTDGKP